MGTPSSGKGATNSCRFSAEGARATGCTPASQSRGKGIHNTADTKHSTRRTFVCLAARRNRCQQKTKARTHIYTLKFPDIRRLRAAEWWQRTRMQRLTSGARPHWIAHMHAHTRSHAHMCATACTHARTHSRTHTHQRACTHAPAAQTCKRAEHWKILANTQTHTHP